jgi:DNA-binding PadR family transcriptional regulator
MERPNTYPITYGVLGLLAYWGPLSGYDLKRLFDHLLSTMWGAAHSQIYHELRRMKDLGWVEMERQEQESRPDRKVYSITEAGREALEEWQKEPAGVLQMRDELLMKVFFGAFAASPADLITNIKKSLEEHEMRLAGYRQNGQFLSVRSMRPREGQRANPYISTDEDENPFFPLILRFAIDFEKMYLQWLRQTLSTLEEQPPLQ